MPRPIRLVLRGPAAWVAAKAAFERSTPRDLTPAISWPSFAAGSVFATLVFVMATLAVRA